jgi:alpha-ribazole phosphatase
VTRLYWVRHAPTHLRVLAPPGAPADLSDRTAFAALSSNLPPVPVISSHLPRARQTADALAGPRPRWPDERGLAEFDHGAWTGLTWDEIGARWPDLSRAYLDRPGSPAPPGGESWDQGAARVSAAADRIADRAGPTGGAILVSHMGAILTQVARAGGLTAAEVLAQPIAPLSLTVLVRRGQRWAIDRVNVLPADLAWGGPLTAANIPVSGAGNRG